VKLQKLVQCCLEPDFKKRKSVPELWDEWNSVKVEDTGMYVTYNEFLDKVPERYWAQVNRYVEALSDPERKAATQRLVDALYKVRDSKGKLKIRG